MQNKLRSQLKGKLKSAAASTGKAIEKSYDRLLDRRVCLGVTGFSRSGKSTFLTSLIHQLRHYPNATLPAFSPALQNRLLGVELHSLPGNGQKDFPFFEGQKALSANSQCWPKSTRTLSSCLLELRLKPHQNSFGLPRRKVERLFVEIRDYPGEWLLDLPLLDMSFQQWCLDCHRLFQEQPRRQILGALYDDLAAIDPLSIVDTETINTLHHRFTAFLKKCSESSLSLIQPGRFLLPDSGSSSGSGSESDFKTDGLPIFVPLLSSALKQLDKKALEQASENSYFKVLEAAYNRYTNELVKPFYREHFSKIDRQVVLVDVLQTLNAGKNAMEDMQLALARVMDSFQFGSNSFLARLFKPRIDKILFVASKIDQVLPEQHENVRALTAALVQGAYRKATFEQVDVYCEATASVRATTIHQNNDRTMLQGLFVADDGDTQSIPGLMTHPDIPQALPDDHDWERFRPWQLRQLLPPANLKLTEGGSLPHIRLDVVIRELLGDKC